MSNLRIVFEKGSIDDLFSILFKAMVKYVFSLVVKFSLSSKKEIMRAMRKEFTDEEIARRLLSLSIKKKRLTEKMIVNLRKLIKKAVALTGIKKLESIVISLEKEVIQDIVKEAGMMFFDIQNRTEKSITHISAVNRKYKGYDFNLLFAEYDNLNTRQNFKAFQNIMEDDLKGKYMNEIMRDDTIKKIIKDDNIKFYKNGRWYNIEKYVEAKAKWSTIDTLRKVEEFKGEEKQVDIFRFERFKFAKEPRETHSHKSVQGKLFSLSGSVTSYKGEKVRPFSYFENLPANDRITRHGYSFAYPYGCGHIFSQRGA